MKRLELSLLLKPCAIAACMTALTTTLVAQENLSFRIEGNYEVKQLAFTSNGKTLISKSGNEPIQDRRGVYSSPAITFWDVETKMKKLANPNRDISRASCIATNGDMVAWREENRVSIFSAVDLKPVRTIQFSDNKQAFGRPIGFTADNKMLVIEQNNKSNFYHVSDGTMVADREVPITGSAHYISGDDKYLVETYADSVRVWDLDKGRDKGILRCGKPGKSELVRTFIFSPENRFAATVCDNVVKVWDLLTMKQAYTFNIGYKDNIFAFSNDGRYLAGGSDTLRLWEILPGREPKEIKTPVAFDAKITAVAFGPDVEDARYVAAGDAKGMIRLWRFTEENISREYYATEIKREMNNIKQKGEFETTDEYNKRVQKLKRSIYNKHLTMYTEHTNEKTIQENALESYDQYLAEIQERIKNSRQTITLRIDSVSAYNADKETFIIKVSNDQERFSRTETIRVPRRDNCAINFKNSYQTAVVTAIKQLKKDDMNTYEIFNIKIKSNCAGSDREYLFSDQREFIDLK